MQVFKKLGDGGFLGPTREPDYGGLGLDYSYSVAIAEELGSIQCGGVPMAIGVQTGTMSTLVYLLYYGEEGGRIDNNYCTSYRGYYFYYTA